MFRPIALAVVAALVAPATGAAMQDNVYGVSAVITPNKAGKKKRPVPVKIAFAYTVDEIAGKRPALIRTYDIHFKGLRVNTRLFQGCSAERIDLAQSDSVCPRRALVGTGAVLNATGASNDEADRSLACFLELRIYNARRNRATLYLHGEPKPDPADPRHCPLTLDKAIDARFVRTRGGTSLRFDVDEVLLHPAPGFDNAVVAVRSEIRRLTRKVRQGGQKVRRGFFESFGGCRKGRRAVTVTFTTTTGDATRERTHTRCRG